MSRAGNVTGTRWTEMSHVYGTLNLPMSLITGWIGFNYTTDDTDLLSANWQLEGLTGGGTLLDFEFYIDTRFNQTVVGSLSFDSSLSLNVDLNYPISWQSLGITLQDNSLLQLTTNNQAQQNIVQIIQRAIMLSAK